MSLIEFAEKVLLIPLTEGQKHFLKVYEMARNEGKELYASFPRANGREMVFKIIREWEGCQGKRDMRQQISELRQALLPDNELYNALVASIESAIKEMPPRIDRQCMAKRIADRIVGKEE